MIRKLTVNDLSDFNQWVSQIPQTPLFNWTHNQLLDSFKNDRCWGLWSAGALQSVVCLTPVMEPWEILWLATRPQGQGRGFMSELLRGLINDAKNHEGRQSLEILLEVHEMNRNAIKLYKDLGFQEFGRRKNYYKDGASALLMTLKV